MLSEGEVVKRGFRLSDAHLDGSMSLRAGKKNATAAAIRPTTKRPTIQLGTTPSLNFAYNDGAIVTMMRANAMRILFIKIRPKLFGAGCWRPQWGRSFFG